MEAKFVSWRCFGRMEVLLCFYRSRPKIHTALCTSSILSQNNDIIKEKVGSHGLANTGQSLKGQAERFLRSSGAPCIICIHR